MQQAGLGGRNVELIGIGHNELEKFPFRKEKIVFLRILCCWKDSGDALEEDREKK